MIGFVLFTSGLALLGGAAFWWMGRRSGVACPAAPESARVGEADDRLPESGAGRDEMGLATFYAYQMAAGKIHRSR